MMASELLTEIGAASTVMIVAGNAPINFVPVNSSILLPEYACSVFGVFVSLLLLRVAHASILIICLGQLRVVEQQTN